MSVELTILGAAYGPSDQTAKIWSLVKDQTLSVKADNSVFGDTWTGVKKSLVIVYRYTGQTDKVAIASEGETIELTPPSEYTAAPKITLINQRFDSSKITSSAKTFSRQVNASSQQLSILGAAYGLSNVTYAAKGKVQNTTFDQVANNATWGDGWPGVKKTLVVVYMYGGVPMLDVVEENERMYFLVSPAMYILGAAYGLCSVTDKVQTLVTNRALSVTANNATFGDMWYGIEKSLVVVYQYGDEIPCVAIAKENSSIDITYKSAELYAGSADSNHLTIIGAAYGLGNVTSKCQSLVTANDLDITANNATFGDTWEGVKKSLVIVYQYGTNQPLMTITAENDKQVITKNPTPTYAGLIDASNLLDDGDLIALSASNDKYVEYDSQYFKLIASANTVTTSCQLRVEKSAQDRQSFRIKGDNGKYVTVGQDDCLYVNGSQGNAMLFTISYSMYGGVRFATTSSNCMPSRYVRLNLQDQSLVADAVDNFSEGTAFDIAINIDAAVFRSSRSLEELSECEIAQLSFVWQLTGGFFLAIGVGPYFSTGKPDPGLLALIRTNPAAWNAVQNLIKAILSAENAVAIVPTAIATIGVLYSQDLLWTIMKSLLELGIWTLLTKVLAKVIQVIFLPEAEIALLLASFTTWAVQLVKGGIDVGSACN